MKSKSEAKIQQECFLWFNNNVKDGFIFSVPNEGSSAKEQMYKKMLGMRAGVSDMIVLQKNRCVFIEFKSEVGNQSENQEKFQKIVEKLGFEYFLIKTLKDFTNLFAI
jgi:hypothetical protein